jgi:sortase A
MKWGRIFAYVLIVTGFAYASYSGVSYYQKLSVAGEISTPVPNQAEIEKYEQQKKQQGENISQDWVIIPKHERLKSGEYLGVLQIPKIDLEVPVFEGTHEKELAKGVGHYRRSVFPGEPDNAVLSGHRDTVFRRLGELKKGDLLQVSTKHGVFIYRVTKTWVTDANDRSVIVSHDEPILTLTTCYPFTFIGPAPDRYVVQSELIKRL